MEFIIDSIVLRKPEEKDAEGFIEICTEKETMEYYGLSELGYNRIEAFVDHRNSASTHLLRKNGFQFEGTFTDQSPAGLF